jgi:lipopolysaccharide transport system permease protein
MEAPKSNTTVFAEDGTVSPRQARGRFLVVHAELDAVAGWPVAVLEPTSGWRLLDLAELWRHRELLFFLAWRDVKVRYKQTVLGVAWALLQPVLLMLIFTACLGGLAGMGSAEYPLHAYLGLLPWSFFAGAVGSAAGSVVGNERLVTKVYFPRLAIPLAAVGVALVDFFIALPLQGIMQTWYGHAPTWEWMVLPVIWMALLITAVGVGTLLAALTVQYRDFRHALPFLMQSWMFATPAIYLPAETTRSAWFAVNPLTGLVEAHRAASLGLELPWQTLALSIVWSVVLVTLGCLYFRRVEESFADIV